MTNLTKIILFVFIVTCGIIVINNTLSASTVPCHCASDSEAQAECISMCWQANDECLYVILFTNGCEYGDCITWWRLYCESGGGSYYRTEWEDCPECDWIY